MQLLTRFFLTTFLLSLQLMLYGQGGSNVIIKGKVYDNEGNPVEAANITILNRNDSTFITGTSSDKSGSFRIETDTRKNLLIKISYIGLKTIWKEIKSIKDNTFSQDFHLAADSKLLKETIITAEAPPVVITGDTISYSAAAIPLHDGAVLEDLIKRIPGAELTSEGKITLNGKEISKIMIDGKEFFTNNPEIALKNLPADAVKDVKTYDRKSDMARTTGIDDGEEVNVLDVTIKEDMKKGWFGNILAGVGYKDKYEGGTMINRFRGDMQISVIGAANNTNGQGYNDIADADVGVGGRGAFGESTTQSAGINFSIDKKTLEFHADVSYMHDNQNIYRKDSRETFLTQGSSFEFKENNRNSSSHDLRGDIRLRWRPDSLTDIHFNHHSGYSKSSSLSDQTSSTLDSLMLPVNNALSHISNGSERYSSDGNIMFNRRLRKKGRNITIHLGYNISDSKADEAILSDTHFHTNDSLAIINRITRNINDNISYRLNVAYSEPLWKDAFFRMSYKYNSSKSNAERNPVFSNETGPALEAIDNMTFNYNNRHTVEATIQGKIKIANFNIAMGIVPIKTHTRIDRGINAGLDRSQTSLNYQPAANIVFRLDKRRQLRISYRGMSSAPSIMDLQEIIDISDPMNLQYGNPNLKNTFRQSVILGYTGYNAEKGSNIMLHIMASNTINGITQKTVYDAKTGVRSTRMENINGNWNSYAALSYSSPFRNRKFNAGTNIYTNYSHRVGFSSMSLDINDTRISISDNIMIGNTIYASYRNDRFDCYVSANFDSNILHNNLENGNSSNTYNLGLSGNTNINLPWDMFFSTDISYVSRYGYSEGYNRNVVLWNAQISKNFLKNRQATIRLKVYDILQSQDNTFRTMAFDYTQDTETNMVGSYFIVHFIYRINSMGKPPKHGPGKRGPRPPMRHHI